MEGTILLSSDENTRKIEDEEKAQFVMNVISSMGIPTEDILNDNSELSIENKIKLRNLLATYNVNVIDSSDGELQIYVDNEIVAHWKKPTYILKRDLSAHDPKKKLFLEMKINFWSIFENT